MITIKIGDCRTMLKELPDESVQACVTSPPYWGLRNYGHDDQIGLENSPADYVETMRQVFKEVWRVLRSDGTVWMNLGDTYGATGNRNGLSGSTITGSKEYGRGCGGEKPIDGISTGLKPKNLIGIPWRVAFALQADGWYLRSDIIWHKPNPMPESVTDRPTRSHEYIFLLTKSERYHYDHEAIVEQAEMQPKNRFTNGRGVKDSGYAEHRKSPGMTDPETRNKRDVWTVPTASYSDAHFATFPPDLIKPCILAGTKPGDIVLDPFFGSGTTGMVALELGRQCIGIELNPNYAELAQQRCNVTPGFKF